MTRKEEYKQYLISEQWGKLRTTAMKRTNGMCQFCNDIATQVHHVRYPKQLGTEHPDTLIPVCEQCHKTAHGIKQMNELINPTNHQIETLHGSKMMLLKSQSGIYGDANMWARALRVPQFLQVFFFNALPRHANLTNADEQMAFNGQQVYKWPVVARALRAIDKAHKDGINSTENTTEKVNQKREFMRNYESLLEWGYELQNQALAGNTQNNNNQFMEVLIQNLQALTGKATAHDGMITENTIRIEKVEEEITQIKTQSRLLPDKSKILTAKEWCRENSITPESTPLDPRNRWTYDQLLSKKLETLGIHPAVYQGQAERLPNSSKTIRVHLWKWSDVEKANDHLQMEIFEYQEMIKEATEKDRSINEKVFGRNLNLIK